MIRNVLIPTNIEKDFLDRVQKINRRLKRVGVDGFVIKSQKRVTKNSSVYTEFEVEISNPLGLGFQLVGKIDVTRDNGNVVFMFDDATPISQRHIDCGGECDHCNTTRNRKSLYIVRDSHGIEMIVGSSCMEVAVGFDERNLRAFEKAYREITDENWGVLIGDNGYSIRNLVAKAIITARKYGYVSKSYVEVHGGQSTVDRVMHGPEIVVTEKDLESADYAIALGQAIDPKNNFEVNLRTIAGYETVISREVGFVVYLAKLYLDETTPKTESNFVGKEKERIKGVDVNVTRVFSGVGFNGNYWIITMQDGQGNDLVWMTSTYPEFKVGDKKTIDFTVKSHDIYKGKKQTKVLRVKEN